MDMSYSQVQTDNRDMGVKWGVYSLEREDFQ